MLGVTGYKSKKQLRESIGKPLRVVETSAFGLEFEPNGRNTVVGPDAFKERKWYAVVVCKDGLIVKVS